MLSPFSPDKLLTRYFFSNWDLLWSCWFKVCYSPLNAKVLPHQILTPMVCLKKMIQYPKISSLRTPCSPFLNGHFIELPFSPFPDKLIFIMLVSYIFPLISPWYQYPIRLVEKTMYHVKERQENVASTASVFHSSWDPTVSTVSRRCKAIKVQPKDMKLMSLDWFKGKITGNHGFHHQI